MACSTINQGLIPDDHTSSSLAQTWLYDPQETWAIHSRRNRNPNPQILQALGDMLQRYNPFIVKYRTARELLESMDGIDQQVGLSL